jgi:hypothetical protein
MAINQSKKILDKINVLFHQYTNNKQLSSLEHDLMLGYIRDFYESILESEIAAAPMTNIPEPAPEPNIPQETPKLVTEQPVIQTEMQTSQVSSPAPEPDPVPIMEEIIPIQMSVIEIPETPVAPAKTVAQRGEPETLNEDFQAIMERIKKQAAQPEQTEQRPLIKPAGGRVDHNALFEEKSGRELSDKLGEMPIDDLKKGMSLNERIIFLNELFDGNKSEFDNALQALNNAEGFENAKKQLIILATRFEWATKERQAKTFIKLVKRRHNKQ